MRAAVSFVVMLHAATAYAETADELFQKGQKLIDAGQIDAACAAFAASFQIDPQLGLKLNLADCRERQGQLVVAYQLFDEARLEAARANMPGRETFARDHAKALRAKITRYAVRVAEPVAAGLVVEVGGRVVTPAEWTTPRWVMPGVVVVEARAPDRKPYRIDRMLTGGGDVVIEVPVLEPAVVVQPRVPVDGQRRGRSAFVFGGIGSGLLVGSLVLGVAAKSTYNAAIRDLDQSKLDAAEQRADVATVAAIVGGACVAVGVVLYFRRGRDRVVLVPTAGRHDAGVAVSGGF